MTRAAHPRRPRNAITGSVATGFVLQATIVVSGVLAARLLGVEDRGHLALLWIIALILAQLGSLGVPSAVTYFIAEGRVAPHRMMRRVGGLAGIQAAGLLCVHALVLWIVLRDRASDVQVAGVITLAVPPAGVAHQYGLAMLQGGQRFGAYNALRFAPILFYSLGLAVVFGIGSASLVDVTAVWAGATTICCLITLAVAWRVTRHGPSDQGPEAPTTREAVGFGARALLGTFSGFEQLQLDQAVAGALLSTHALGLYAVAIAFSNLPRLIGTSIGIVAFPAIAGAVGAARIRQLWRHVAIAAVACGSVVLALEAMLPTLVLFFFGREFEAATGVAQLLLVAGLLQALRRVLSDGMRGAGYPTIGTVAEVVAWVVFLPAAAVLSAAHGLEGLAVGVLLGSGASLAMIVAGAVVLLRRAPQGVAGTPGASATGA